MGKKNRQKRQSLQSHTAEEQPTDGDHLLPVQGSGMDNGNDEEPRSEVAQDGDVAPPVISLQDAPPASNNARSSLKRAAPDAAEDATNGQDGGGKWEVVHSRKKQKKLSKNYPTLTFLQSSRLQNKIKVSDLRDLIMYILADGNAPHWIAVANRTQIRKAVVIMVPGLEEAMFKSGVDFSHYLGEEGPTPAADGEIVSPDVYLPRPLVRDALHEALQPFADMFPHLWPVKTPGDERYGKMFSPIGTFLTTPKSKESKDKNWKGPPPVEPTGWKNERTRITQFIASPEELAENNYAIHPVYLSQEQRDDFKPPDGWVATRIASLEEAEVPEEEIESGSVTAGRKVLALDCEMVKTGEDEFSLARISVMDWAGDSVMEELVKPDKPVIDYVTNFSGITEEMLAPVTTTLKDIQERLLDIITPQTILVGHSLESDFKALRLIHPFVVDTSLIYPHTRGPPLKASLKWLTQKFLNREIQRGHGLGGHNSIEDAKACLDLTRQKCEKGKLWGLFEGSGENLFRRLRRAGRPRASGLEPGRTSASVDWGDPSHGTCAGANHSLSCQSDEDVVESILRAVQGDPDGREIPGGGVDFVWARMRELEVLRGWWNNNRSANPTSRNDTQPPVIPTPAANESENAYSELERALRHLVTRLKRIHEALPPCTTLLVFSGSGDPRPMARLQAQQAQWRREYNTPGMKWDELSVKWTDTENQELKRAVRKARAGVGFISVK